MRDRAVVNAKNGYITLDVPINRRLDAYTLRSKRDDAVTVELELQYEGMVELRAMLWDAMRKQGRGFEISIDDVLKIEEVRHKGRYSVEGYEEEINWTIDLLKKHLKRIEGWKETPADHRNAYGKLDEFLSQLEAPPAPNDTAQCQICGCTLDVTGMDIEKKYVCEDCRSRNPTHRPTLQTAPYA